MGALAVAVAKKGENVVPDLSKMLGALRHRGRDAHGIAADNSVTITETIEELSSSGIESSMAFGHNFARIIPSDIPQPFQGNGITLVFEGRLFPPIGRCEVIEVIEMMKNNSEEEAKRLIKEEDGSYTFALQHRNRIIAGRDSFGTVPLYYGENEKICALASERKALWVLGIWNVKSFPPGNLAIIDHRGISFQPVKILTKPLTETIEEDSAIKKLLSLLLESVRERTLGIEKIALAFSGGLDSSLIAALAKECGVQVLLVAVGLEGQPETQHAENVAEMLGLPFKAETFTFDDVENIFPKVLWLVEEPDVLKVSVAIPFFWTAETASNLDYKVLLAGQGGDELFGGYSRYLRDYKKSVEAVENALYRDTLLSYEVNFERDNKVCAFHDVELRLPFIDQDMISFSLSLPVKMKMESVDDPIRKRILRKLAKNIGLPPEVYDKPKKAVQYSTGVDKALKKLAKKQGQKIQEFVKQSFRNIEWNVKDALAKEQSA